MANVYQRTKLEPNISISYRRMAKKPKSKMAAAILFLVKWDLGLRSPDMVNIY